MVLCQLCCLLCFNFFVLFGFFSVFEFCFSHFLDGFWFFFSFLFIFVFIYRLFLLMYFGSCGFLSFDLVKLFGFQWYWLYFLCLDSCCVVNLLLESDYFVGDLRLLQLTQFLLCLTFVLYKFWLSSCDVIHSFTLPCLGVKVDCLPGRCNELLLFTTCLGLFYGQCSELCGVLHGFMPVGLVFCFCYCIFTVYFYWVILVLVVFWVLIWLSYLVFSGIGCIFCV